MRNLYSQLVLVPVFLFIALAISSCRSDLDELTPGSGALIFEDFVAIGDGYVAGYSNWGLYEFSQENSLPNLLSQQFSLVREIDFDQPILNGSGTGYNELESLSRKSLSLNTTYPNLYRKAEASGSLSEALIGNKSWKEAKKA
ncbi:MAG: hypothetical protein AAFR66_24880, partial [Bacteroidota bacterium]